MQKHIKVLVFSQHPRGTSGGGILRYCRELKELFDNNSSIDINLITELPYPNKMWGAKYNRRELEKVINDSQCDIVHVNGYVTLGVVQLIKTAKKLGKKVVYTPHWHPFETLRRPKLGKWFFNLLLKPLIRRNVDAIITFNNEDTAFFGQLNPHLFKIPHWVKQQPIDAITPTERNKKMILFVGGRLNDTNKGIEHIYSIPIGKYDIHIVGNGDITFRKDITKHTNISDEELFQLYKTAALVVVPSRYESFSYVSLEALSCGTPIVISDRVRIGDYLKNCPICRVFKYRDFTDFNTAISSFSSDTSNSDTYLAPFLPEKARSSYLTLYQSVLSHNFK